MKKVYNDLKVGDILWMVYKRRPDNRDLSYRQVKVTEVRRAYAEIESTYPEMNSKMYETLDMRTGRTKNSKYQTYRIVRDEEKIELERVSKVERMIKSIRNCLSTRGIEKVLELSDLVEFADKLQLEESPNQIKSYDLEGNEIKGETQ